MRAHRHGRFRRRTLLLWLCLAVLVGVSLGRTGFDINGVWPLLLVPLLITTWPKQGTAALVAALLFGLLLGWWRGSVFNQRRIQLDSYEHQKVSILATADEDGFYSGSQLSFVARNVDLNGQHLAGKLKLSGFGTNAIFQGDRVLAIGKFYPGSGSTQGSISYAQLTVISHHPSLVADIRRKFAAGLQTALPEPLASFAMGLLIGQRDDLPAEVKQNLLMVGLTHIIAVSGYNLTVILNACRRLLAKHSKRLATAVTIGLLAGFLLLAGASASIVRAAIVSMLSIIASYYGREFKPLNLLILAAAITAWADPFYIWGDISWYLSFLAFYGIMILAPLIQIRFPGRWHESVLVGVALETVCAETMSLPFILHEFGQMSLVGLPANVLVVSLVPLAMLLSLLAGLGGMLVAGISGWLAWPAIILLNYMLDMAHLLAHIPHIFLQNRSLSLLSMVGLYIVIVLLTLALYHKTKRPKHATITDRNVRSQQMVNN